MKGAYDLARERGHTSGRAARDVMEAGLGVGNLMFTAPGALVGAGAGKAVGKAHNLADRLRGKEASARTRAGAAALGALGAGTLGGYLQHQKSKERKGGKSREELSREESLASLKRRLENELSISRFWPPGS